MQRRRSIFHTFGRNIAAEKSKLEAQLPGLTPSSEADALRRKIRQFDTATHINDWLRSPGLKPPE